MGLYALLYGKICGNQSRTVVSPSRTDYCAYTLTMHLNEYSGVRWEVGYASAIAFIMFLLMFGSNMLIHKLLSKVGQ